MLVGKLKKPSTKRRAIINNGRNQQERAAIAKLSKLMDPQLHMSYRMREQLANACIMHTVNAAIAMLEETKRREERQAEAMKYVKRQQWDH